MASNSPSRSWCFTWNNPPPDAYDRIRVFRGDLVDASDRIAAVFIGREVSATGTPHLQGYLVMQRPCRLAHLRRTFPGVHFEVRRGTEPEAIEYTKKEGNPDRLDWDDRKQGSRTDLAAVAALVQANPKVGVRSVAAMMPTAFVKYHAGVTALARALLPIPPLIRDVSVFWYYGPTGTGKSWTALQEALSAAGGLEGDVFRWTVPNLKFASSSYNGQRFVIMDELRSTWQHFTFGYLLTLLDKYRAETELKGGDLFWAPTHIWITTPLHPADFVTDEERRGNPMAIGQLTRRITVCKHFTELYVAPPVAAPSADDQVPPCPPADPSPSPPSAPRPVTPPLPRTLPVTESEPEEVSLSLRRRPAMRLCGRSGHRSDTDDDYPQVRFVYSCDTRPVDDVIRRANGFSS